MVAETTTRQWNGRVEALMRYSRSKTAGIDVSADRGHIYLGVYTTEMCPFTQSPAANSPGWSAMIPSTPASASCSA
jgi:hypothetical protein